MDGQSYNNNQSLKQPTKGKSGSLIKNIITVIFLVIIPPIGIILMWFIASWSHKIKVIITTIWILMLLTGIVLVSLPSGGARQAASEARIESGMSQIRTLLELQSYEKDRPSKITCTTDSNFVVVCEEIKNLAGSNPIIQMSSTGSSPDYCAYVEISPDEYYCVDSSAKRGRTTTFPGDTGYCTSSSFVCPPTLFQEVTF